MTIPLVISTNIHYEIAVEVQVSTDSQQLEDETSRINVSVKETLRFNVSHHPTYLTHLKMVSFAVFCFLMRLKVHLLLQKI